MRPDALSDSAERRGRLEAEKSVQLLESLRQRTDRELAWRETSSDRGQKCSDSARIAAQREEAGGAERARVPELGNEVGD